MTQTDQNEGRGGTVSDAMDAVCQNSPLPCLILDKSRTVVAANDGVCRLTLKSREAGSQNTLIGKTVGELGFVAVPAQSSRYQDFEALLNDYPLDPQSALQLPHVRDRDHESEADFWAQEDGVACASLEVVVSRETAIRGQMQPLKLTQIRARMSLRYLRLGSDLAYMITFDRPRPAQSLPVPQALSEKLESSKAIMNDHVTGKVPAREVHGITKKAIPYTTATLDLDGRALELSRAWYEFFETTEYDSLGTKWFNVIHPEDIELLATARTDATRNDEDMWSHEVRYRTKDDTYRWSIIRAASSRDESGTITSWYASMMDIDELLRSSQEARNWRGSIMTLAANADICLWGLRADRTLFLKEGSMSWDPTIVLDSQSEIETTARHSADKSQASLSIGSIEGAIKAVLEGRFAALRVEHTSSDRWYQSTLVADGCDPAKRDSGQGRQVLGLTIDTTDARARTKLETENASLMAKERVAKEASESKSRFLANTSHELRTPIAGIIGLNNLLKESLAEKRQHEFSDSINLSAGLLLTLVNDVLDLSKIEAGRMEIESVPFRVSKLVDTIRSVMTVQADQKGLEFHCVFSDVPPGIAIVGDPNRLQQVLLNLLSNSIKFTKSGSVKMTVVKVPSENDTKPDNSNPLGADKSILPPSDVPDTVEFEFVVEDTGCGMDPETITKSFKAFSQANSSTARQYGGTGLGLTISRQLVDMMGGTLRLTSSPSVGTTARFQIVFPQVDTTIDDHEIPAMSEATPNISHEVRKAGLKNNASLVNDSERSDAAGNSDDPKKHETKVSLTREERGDRLVLIAEDNEVNMKIALLMIEKLGFQVVSAQNGKEALDMLLSRMDSKLPLPDVILMDCMMPIKDGYEATRSLRDDTGGFPARLRDIPIVALTAYATKGEQKKCLDAGMDDYLTKPINKAALQQTLDKWCLSGRT